MTVTPLGAAAGAGTALLVVAAWPPRPAEPGEAGLRPFVLAGLAVVLAPWAAALGAGGSALPLAAVSLGLAWWSGRRVLVAGAALTALAVVAQHLHTGTWHLDGANGAAASMAMAGAAVVLFAAGGRADPGWPLAVPVLLAAVVTAPALTALAVPAAVLAVMAAASHRPPAAIGMVALAAAAVPVAHPAGLLLAAAAVLALPAAEPGAVLALPGAVHLAADLRSGHLPPVGWAVALGAVAAAALLARPSRWRRLPPPASWPALATAVALLVAPGSFRWAGPHGLAAYDRGAVVAIIAAGAALAAMAAPRLRKGRSATAEEEGAQPAAAEPG